LRLVDRVALRLCLPAQQALGTWQGLGSPKIPSPDAALGDDLGRSATNATKASQIHFGYGGMPIFVSYRIEIKIARLVVAGGQSRAATLFACAAGTWDVARFGKSKDSVA
jgi:hypothetical protein